MKRLILLPLVVFALLGPAQAADANFLPWGKAKRAALRVADRMPISWLERGVSWCNRWSRHEVHCGVWASDGSSEIDGEVCDVTTVVGIRHRRDGRLGRIRVRMGKNLSCIDYGSDF
jgi:hypothetical protein